jgi:hypothetical protein
MGRTLRNYILLGLVILGSFIAIYTYDSDQPYDESLDSLRLLTPGMLFSVFIIVVHRTSLTNAKLILLFFILVILYGVCFVAGLSSWGIGVPFVGGIGALIIRKLFYRSADLLDAIGKDYLVFGFAAGLVGLFLFVVLQYALQDLWTAGAGFGFVLATWQLVFGTLWIKEKRPISKGLELNGPQHKL